MDRISAVRLLCRVSAARNAVIKQQFHSSGKVLSANDSSSSSSSDSDAEKHNKKEKKVVKGNRDEAAKQQTVDLLNALLLQMNGEKLVTKTIDLAVPVRKPAPKKVKEKTLEEKIKVAAKEAAETLGGDVKKKEEELLDKIFSAGTPPPPAAAPVKKSKKKKQKQEKMEATSEAKEETAEQKTEVTAKPKEMPEKKEEAPEPSLSELLAAMKIDRTPKKLSEDEGLPFARAEKIRELARKFQPRSSQQNAERFAARARREVVADLYAGKPFTVLSGAPPPMPAITTTLNTWEALEEKELKLLITHPPDNYFEELIQWTERGILWKFPIDNEQGMEAEQSVHFSEHVFLDRHLQDWCPKKGPIRHFMELVCTGLSKNPYMTVEEKKGHIMWYRDYFGDKQKLLKEIGAIDKDILPEGEAKKQVEA